MYGSIFSLGWFQTTPGWDRKCNPHLTAMALIIAIKIRINCYYKISVADVIMNEVS